LRSRGRVSSPSGDGGVLQLGQSESRNLFAGHYLLPVYRQMWLLGILGSGRGCWRLSLIVPRDYSQWSVVNYGGFFLYLVAECGGCGLHIEVFSGTFHHDSCGSFLVSQSASSRIPYVELGISLWLLK